jgi:hypothetical protein
LADAQEVDEEYVDLVDFESFDAKDRFRATDVEFRATVVMYIPVSSTSEAEIVYNEAIANLEDANMNAALTDAEQEWGDSTLVDAGILSSTVSWDAYRVHGDDTDDADDGKQRVDEIAGIIGAIVVMICGLTMCTYCFYRCHFGRQKSSTHLDNIAMPSAPVASHYDAVSHLDGFEMPRATHLAGTQPTDSAPAMHRPADRFSPHMVVPLQVQPGQDVSGAPFAHVTVVEVQHAQVLQVDKFAKET